MSANGVQSFLTGKHSYLATYKVKENCSGTYPSPNYYHCGKTVSAAQDISDAASTYGLNPQVILGTLQKEEDLVTDPTPSASQLNSAMGYGCPDSGSCSSTYKGFFNQVDWGTYALRKNYARSSGDLSWYPAAGSSYACPSATQYYSQGLYAGNNVTFYDDYGTAYTHFVIANPATASMYCYTPHVYPGSHREYYSGSYWFDYYFSLWFGNPAADTSKDQVIVGDWNGQKVSGHDVNTPAIKRGNLFCFDNNSDGTADSCFTWGRDTDQVIVGDWNGDGKDSIGLRRSNHFFLSYDNNAHTNSYFSWGRDTDQVIPGNWFGSPAGNITGLGLKRGNEYFLDYNNDGTTDTAFLWGKSAYQVIVGDWNGDGKDSLGIKNYSNYCFDDSYDVSAASCVLYTY